MLRKHYLNKQRNKQTCDSEAEGTEKNCMMLKEEFKKVTLTGHSAIRQRALSPTTVHRERFYSGRIEVSTPVLAVMCDSGKAPFWNLGGYLLPSEMISVKTPHLPSFPLPPVKSPFLPLTLYLIVSPLHTEETHLCHGYLLYLIRLLKWCVSVCRVDVRSNSLLKKFMNEKNVHSDLYIPTPEILTLNSHKCAHFVKRDWWCCSL